MDRPLKKQVKGLQGNYTYAHTFFSCIYVVDYVVSGSFAAGTRGTACPFAHGPEELAEISRIAGGPANGAYQRI